MAAAAPAASTATASPPVAAVFRTVLPGEWAEAQAAGTYAGAEIDRKDGFIHLSTASQMPGTLAAFFAEKDVVILRVKTDGLPIRWDPVEERGGELFPHLYAPALPLSAVERADPVAWAGTAHAADALAAAVADQ